MNEARYFIRHLDVDKLVLEELKINLRMRVTNRLRDARAIERVMSA
jgi:hypothetical protein